MKLSLKLKHPSLVYGNDISVFVISNTIDAPFIQNDLYCMYLYYVINWFNSLVAFYLVALISYFVYLYDFKVGSNKH